MAEGARSTRHPTAPVSRRVQMPQTSPAPHRLLGETNLIPITTRQPCLPPKLRVQLRLASHGEGPQTLFSPLEMLPLGAGEAAGLRRHRGEGSSSGAIAPLPGGAIQLPQLHCISKPCSLPPSPRKITFATAPKPSILPRFDDTKKAGYPTPTTDTRGWDGRRHRRVPVPDIRHGAAFASHRRNPCLHIAVPLRGCEQPLHFHSAQQTSVSIACFGQK